MAILAHLLTVVCPVWCSLPAGHEPDHVDPVDGSRLFVHRAPVLADHPAGLRLDLAQSITVYADGIVVPEPPRVIVGGAHDAGLTVDQARRHAAALTLAADLLAVQAVGRHAVDTPTTPRGVRAAGGAR